MRLLNPYEKMGRAFKGNLHTHSKNPVSTCGDWPAEKVVEIYRKRGYDFIAITNHSLFSDYRHLSDDSFLVMAGQEVHLNQPYQGVDFHFVALGLRETIGVQLTPQEILSKINGQEALPVLAHPHWSYAPVDKILQLDGFNLIEVYNKSCENIRREYSNEEWDGLLTRLDRPIWALAVDDTHHYPEGVGAGWVVVYAGELSEQAILDSLRRGAFYSSQGPAFEKISLSPDGLITVQFSSGFDIRFIGADGVIKKDTVGGMELKADYKIQGDEKYIRIEISDRVGRTAWSNPIFIE